MNKAKVKTYKGEWQRTPSNPCTTSLVKSLMSQAFDNYQLKLKAWLSLVLPGFQGKPRISLLS